VNNRDYLLYGRFYLPTGRLDALYTMRLTPTIQALVAAISDPRSNIPSEFRERNADPSNLMINIQHDIGKWCTEYTWSAEDGMLGVRVLHNFGKLGTTSEVLEDTLSRKRVGVKRVDEEDAVEGGLRGRMSIGAEVYFSAKERSAGVSTGIRFTTLPDATLPSFQVPALLGVPPTPPLTPSALPRALPLQPPTTITALFNPMLGHMSSAYTAQVSKDLSLSSRFDFNVYSFESEWTMGAEWWLRRQPTPSSDESIDLPSHSSAPSIHSTDVCGVLKARGSTNKDVSLMWEGRLRNILVSLGVVSDFSSRSKPIKSVGLEVSYFSSG